MKYFILIQKFFASLNNLPALKSLRCEKHDETFWPSSSSPRNRITSCYINHSLFFVFKALMTFLTYLGAYFLVSPLTLPWRNKIATNATIGMNLVQVSKYYFQDLFRVTFLSIILKKALYFYGIIYLFFFFIYLKMYRDKIQQKL